MSSSLKSICSVKSGALIALVVQNTFLVVYMHYSRVQNGPMYSSSSAVAVMEIVKFVCCIIVIAYEKGGILGLVKALRVELFSQPMEVVKLSVPSILYTVQNNLLYYALTHLDAATFQVVYNVKILTTALFSVTMLGRTLSHQQWFSLLLLTAGVTLAQMSAQQSSSDAKANTWLGFIAVSLAACTSGFSGVYFERIIRTSGTSLWMRNVQMGVSSIIVGFAGIYMSGELPGVMTNGFFYGYNSVVVTVILLQAVGGLVVAVVVKYADNILKGFAAAFSIITSCILSYFFFEFKPTFKFVVGATLVNIATYMYSYQHTPQKAKDDDTNRNNNDNQTMNLIRNNPVNNGVHGNQSDSDSDNLLVTRQEEGRGPITDLERNDSNNNLSSITSNNTYTNTANEYMTGNQYYNHKTPQQQYNNSNDRFQNLNLSDSIRI
eukprot:gene10847-14560_t